ncbi:MAG: hypothetical protein HQL86_08325 [Magnetococcales bacterium]|nr:hypothetical protein [Magnetococcales bacterium]
MPNSLKPIFKLAGRHDPVPFPVENWLRYADARPSTSHDDSGDKAQEAFGAIEGMIVDATRLIRRMRGSDLT